MGVYDFIPLEIVDSKIYLKMNAAKLARMQAQVRIAGKGTARRKKKTVHKSDTTDDKKLPSALQKVRVNQIPGIEEVNLFKEDGNVMHFKNPRVQASLPCDTFALYGSHEEKPLTDLLPEIISQMGPESILHLGKLAGKMGRVNPEDEKAIENFDENIPDLVGDFEEVSKDEVAVVPSQEQENDNAGLDVSYERKEIGSADKDNDALALDLDELALEESETESLPVSENVQFDGVNGTSDISKIEDNVSSGVQEAVVSCDEAKDNQVAQE